VIELAEVFVHHVSYVNLPPAVARAYHRYIRDVTRLVLLANKKASGSIRSPQIKRTFALAAGRGRSLTDINSVRARRRAAATALARTVQNALDAVSSPEAFSRGDFRRIREGEATHITPRLDLSRLGLSFYKIRGQEGARVTGVHEVKLGPRVVKHPRTRYPLRPR